MKARLFRDPQPAPSPLRGEGWGEGAPAPRSGAMSPHAYSARGPRRGRPLDQHRSFPPHPDPLPNGEREKKV